MDGLSGPNTDYPVVGDSPGRIDSDALRVARDRCRVEIDGFMATYDACSSTPACCALLVRAWHALASLEALIRGQATQNVFEFVASLGREDRRALPRGLHHLRAGFVAAVLACALSDPWVAPAALDDRELDEHRHIIRRVFAQLDRLDRRAGWRARMFRAPRRRLVRAELITAIVAAVAVSSLALSLALALDRPRWDVSYYANDSLSGPPILTARVPRPDRDWAQGGPGVGLPTDDFSARFETCLLLDRPAGVVFTIGSDDGSRLFVDGHPVIDAWSDHGYTTREESIALDPGAHTLRLEYYERRGVAQLSFGGRMQSSLSDITGLLHLPSGFMHACAPLR